MTPETKDQRWHLRNQRGSVMIFTLLAIVALLMMGGMAVDLAHQFAMRGEIQRSMDAAALAGAGKIAYVGGGALPAAVRNYAVTFASKNASRNGSITLDPNTANSDTIFNSSAAPYGNVVTGHGTTGRARSPHRRMPRRSTRSSASTRRDSRRRCSGSGGSPRSTFRPRRSRRPIRRTSHRSTGARCRSASASVRSSAIRSSRRMAAAPS